MKTVLIALFLAATPAFASCPASPDIKADLEALFEGARNASSDLEAQPYKQQMWTLWLKAPDDAAQAVLERGMQSRSSYDFLGALAAFSDLVEYCPDYAEGYNQRAFVHFLSGDFENALVDLDRALVLSPDHVGAQSGRALTLLNLGRLGEARIQLGAALENDPWLSERFLLEKGGALAVEGKDI